jgi:mycoredoxin
MAAVKVYGADWCGMTRRTRAHLDDLGVKYLYINIEEDPQASQWVKDQNGGKEKKPTLDIGGYIISEPSNIELEQALRQQRVLM